MQSGSTIMRRYILLAALLFATGAASQEPQTAAHRDLWCGLAFDYAAGDMPADATPRQQQVILRYAAGAEMLLERAERRYLQFGYSAARFTALSEQLLAQIAAGLGTAPAPYSFQDCQELLPP
jgi:hypothetical protein